jgi:CheY-like chemotaxis protein
MRPRILVCDDDEEIRSLIHTVLAADYDVVEAEDGDAALRLTRAEHVDLIVMDISMPMMDGIDATRSLKDDPATAGVPVLILTARAHFDDRAAGEEAHAEAYLTKPFDPYQLQKVVQHLLELAEKRRG